MNDPYKVLGISPNATDDEVKNAYRELAKKLDAKRVSDAAKVLQKDADIAANL